MTHVVHIRLADGPRAGAIVALWPSYVDSIVKFYGGQFLISHSVPSQSTITDLNVAVELRDHIERDRYRIEPDSQVTGKDDVLLMTAHHEADALEPRNAG